MRREDAWAGAPFDTPLLERVRALIGTLNTAQRLWLSGYLAGSSERAAPAPVTSAAKPNVTILFGSQTGNSERVAQLLADKLAQQQIEFTLLDMLDCRKSHLEEARTLLVVVSTQGDGVPPDRALPLHELLHGRKAPRLEHLSYSVLALGDASYEHFCETGRQFDARLEALGGTRMQAFESCDVDFEPTARAWIDTLSTRLATLAPRLAVVNVADSESRTARISIAHTRRNPFRAPLLANQRITTRNSSKDVRHVELALEGSHIHYEPGDAIGVVPRNREEDVDELLAVCRFERDTPIAIDAQTLPLQQALTDFYDLGAVTMRFLERYADATATTLLGEPRDRHLIDIVSEHPPTSLSAEQFIALLRPLAPRLYSIASSQRATPDEAHLTVSVVEYQAACGVTRRGVVSGTVAALTSEDATAPIYLHRNSAFRLPQDPHARVIMIGAGTGVAPYRAFLAEREAIGATGASWLVFGDRSFDN